MIEDDFFFPSSLFSQNCLPGQSFNFLCQTFAWTHERLIMITPCEG